MNLFLEKFGPVLMASILSAIFFVYGVDVFSVAKKMGWKIPVTYSSMFDLSSIMTAFIFSFFTFARTSETEFLHKMRQTQTYKRFMKYLVTSMCSSAAVLVCSIPFMIAEPQPLAKSDPWFVLLIVWIWLVVFALTATARSMRQFIALALVEKP